uniref:Uncharacterized protein n=1 Tax=Strombidinopsis acuminata TaxID=141414 RepID=A0A7S3SGZ0_9SPIT
MQRLTQPDTPKGADPEHSHSPLALEDVVDQGPGTPRSECGGGDDDDDNGKRVPKNASHFPTMPPKHMKRILAGIEPVTFSSHNMNALISRGAREVTRSELLKLVEFCTNISPTSNVAPEHRYFNVLEDEMRKLSAMHGRRARDLTLPVDWETQGVYAACMDEASQCTVTLNPTQQKVTVVVPPGAKSIYIG